jgi:4-amino-4-deoxy-L-arabinose transferase-like glycosyltransferase
VAAALLVLLVATSGGYGWHRDELYFLAAGRHPSWGYPDQPLFTPLVVAAGAAVGDGSLTVVRLASALGSAATAVLTGLIAAEMGGGPRARLVAAATWAVGGVSLVTGHFVDTTTFDVLAATGVCWCLARAIRANNARWLSVAGVVLGLGLLNKLIVGSVAAFLIVGVLVAGRRSLLRPRQLMIAALAAAAGAAPYLLWQAWHGWPQLALAGSIAADGAEGGRAGVIPFQIVLVSPLLVPVWVAGLVRLARSDAGKPYRPFAVAYGLYLPFLILTGGKAYYSAGLLPPLVASGALAVDGWLLRRARSRVRRIVLVMAVVLALVINSLIGLDVLPPRLLNGPVMALNPDAGEQVGWPRFIAAVASAWRRIPASQRGRAVIFTSNYGEAGAVDLFGPAVGLPSAYSGHNAFALWGPPPSRAGPVVLVGYGTRNRVARYFPACRHVSTVHNGIGLPNDEQGAPVLLCRSPQEPWSRLWPRLIHYD